MTTRNSKPRAVSKESKVKLEFWEHVLIELQLLSQSENAYILQNLQNRQLAQATAVVQEGFQMIPKISKWFRKFFKIFLNFLKNSWTSEKLLEADGVTWRLIDAGALCFIKDSTRRSYFLNFFRIQQQRQQPLWEHEVYENINIIKQTPFFIQFSATNKQVSHL